MNTTTTFSKTMMILLLAAATVSAQPATEIEMFTQWQPYTALDVPAGDALADAEVEMMSVGFGVTHPVIYGQGATIVEHGLSGHALELDWRNRPSGARGVDRVYALSYSLSVMKSLSDTWRGLFLVQPTLTTDFADGSEIEALNMTGAALFMRPSGTSTLLGYGLAYSMRFGEPFPIPLFMMQWTPQSRWSADILLPAYAELDYAVSKTLTLGVRMQTDGGQFHVAGLESADTIDDPQMRVIDATLGPVINWQAAPDISASLSAGFSLHRELGFYDGDTELTTLDPKAGPTLRLTIVATP